MDGEGERECERSGFVDCFIDRKIFSRIIAIIIV
jgi:hypothetical protein